MNIEFLDTELNIKIKETYKAVLKKKNTAIIFDLPNESLNITESTKIENEFHHFNIYKLTIKNKYNNINKKYERLVKKGIKNLNQKDSEKKLFFYSKLYYLLKPFYGELYNVTERKIELYYVSYNAIILEITKMEYDRFMFYTKYMYKIQQLSKLNKELNINQEFNIIFDDDKAAFNMYNNLYKNFNSIIEPFDKQFLENIRKEQERNNLDDEDEDI
jgi:hypothetical protein